MDYCAWTYLRYNDIENGRTVVCEYNQKQPPKTLSVLIGVLNLNV